MDKLNLDAWIGREAVEVGGVSLGQAAQIHGTIGEGAAPAMDDALPALWHWCAFPDASPMDRLGPDGHVRGSGILPPVHLPRRMWAGGSLTFHKNLHVGQPLERRTRIQKVSEKSGNAGPMVFVTLSHDIFADGELAIEERQDIVYLQIPDRFVPPQKSPLPSTPREQIETSQTLLFRYSAVTFNAHRIHYDLPYTQSVEKYPALLVHGPLQASLLMRAAIRHTGRTPLFFDFRGVHPMFAGPVCDIGFEEDEEGLRLWTGQDGHQCMQARAVWEGAQ